MRKPAFVSLMALISLLALVAAGCNNGSPATSPTTVSLTPGGAVAIDQGQSVTIQATVTGDSTNQGVSWSLTGPGSLTNQTSTSVTYNAPATVTAITSASITATSVAKATASSQKAITVNPPPSVTTTALDDAPGGAAYNYTLQATGGTGAYTWSVPAGSLPAWATLNPATGLISGTANAVGISNFSVAVTDAAGLTSAAQTLSLEVPALAIATKALPAGTTGLPYSAQIQATGGFVPYTWTLTAGSLPTWASLDAASGAIKGTPDAAATSTFTIRITDSAPTAPVSVTQEFSVTVSAPEATGDAKLKGQYAFLFNGFDDATGNQLATVGSFIADGSGNITSGVEDINGPGGYQSALTFTGKYNVGADNRGAATFANSLGSTRFALAVGSPNSDNVATRASLIEFDDMTGTDGKRGSGFVFLQTPNNFGLSNMTGPYAFQFSGQTEQAGSRRVLTGAYSADGSGNLTGGQFDANANGAMSNQTFTASISPTPQTASFGRLTAVATNIPAPDFVFYIVSANRTLAMSTDPESTSGLLSGQILAQSSTAYTAASLNGTSVAYTVGRSVLFSGPDNTSVSGELWTFNGSGHASFSMTWMDGWWGDLEVVPGPATYTVSPNGRVTTAGRPAAAVPENPIFYLVSDNTGFFMTTGASVASGFLEAQEDKPFSVASVSGNYFLGTVAPSQSCSTVTSGVGTSTGNGTLNLTLDTSSPTDFLSFDQSQSLTISVATNGTGVYEQYAGFFYVISGKKIIFLSPGWGDSCPTVMILNQ
jgi:Putative Ig domain